MTPLATKSALVIIIITTLSVLAQAQTPPPAPFGPVPSPRHLAWHDLEYYAFVHFNMNTFTDFEWGHGTETPKTFNPTELDCRQWARVCKAAGMKAIIITAKHHDGFCLWPSKFTEHSVKNSNWRNGQGDLLRELSDACREFGLKFGVYMSPWDRHEPSYGDSPRYNEHFKNQLTETLSNYGEVFEVWFDGACGEGPNGKRQVYDWPGFIQTVRNLQPNAVIFSDAGPDIRWVGNESGFANPTNWSLLKRDEFYPGSPRYRELTSGHRDGTHWLPAECDVSIRPGWYYHQSQDDQVKSLDHLLDIYFKSVGRNASLLLNLPVDRRGLVHENDVKALNHLKKFLDATFTENLAAAAQVTASNTRGNDPLYRPENITDILPQNNNNGSPKKSAPDKATFWAADDNINSATLEVKFPLPKTFSVISLQEYIALGQRIEDFTVDAWLDNQWQQITQGTTIGYQRLLRFPAVTSQKLRLNIRQSRACPTIANFAVYLAPPAVNIAADNHDFIGKTQIRLTSDVPAAKIHYTLDGSEPTTNSPAYTEPITLTKTTTVKALATFGARQTVIPATPARA